MNYFLQTLFITILLFGGCRSSGKTQDSAETNMAVETKSLKVLAAEKLGEGVRMQSSANWVLCTKEVGQRQVVFFVYDEDKSEIVYEDMNPVRSVKWNGAEELLIRPIDRIVPENSSDYTISVRSGVKKQANKKF